MSENSPAAPSLGGTAKRSLDVEIEEWAVVNGSDNPYLAPELCPLRLTGTCVNHPNIPAGEIVSSDLVMIDEEQGIARSMNTQFSLGTPSPDFLKWMKRKSVERPYKFYSEAAEKRSMVGVGE